MNRVDEHDGENQRPADVSRAKSQWQYIPGPGQKVSGYTPNEEIVDWVYWEQEAEAQALGLAS
jgi:hypothetical protein